MTEQNYDVIYDKKAGHRPVFMWTRGVPVEKEAEEQLRRVAALPFIYDHVAAMPDVHYGKGATIGSVIPTKGAVIPAAVGVDVGCGMCAVRTNLTRGDLPEKLKAVRSAIERAVPHGRTDNGGKNDRGAWGRIPETVQKVWDRELADDFEKLVERNSRLAKANSLRHLGTLGTGNHFIEVEVDTDDNVWLMLHSGSRGIGGAIANGYIKAAKALMEQFFVSLPDPDLAYLPDGHDLFHGYVQAVTWAQRFAKANRRLMLEAVVDSLNAVNDMPAFELDGPVIDCHHNYVTREEHNGQRIWVTRKGAVRADVRDLAIIPGSMGARSFIARGKGNPHSFTSCSHGAGRAMSRSEAKRRFNEADHQAATEGVECRKDASVIDETPGAYKDIDTVMAAQADLVEIETELKQVVCVKG